MVDKPEGTPGIKPTAFQPPSGSPQPGKRGPGPVAIALAILAAVLLACLWFVLTATAVIVKLTPEADSLRLKGGIVIDLGGRYLAQPGDYTVQALKTGYHPLEEPITVQAGESSEFSFELKKLPGRLQLNSEPSPATVFIDGEAAGETPLNELKLAPGLHHIELRAKRYKTFETEVDIEGLDKLQEVNAALLPNWGELAVSSIPAGASLFVEGIPRGKTSADQDVVLEIEAGARLLSLQLVGYKPWEQRIALEAGEQRTLAPITLEPASGRVAVGSQPAGAKVLVDGDYRGLTPLTVALEPDTKLRVEVSKAGYQKTSRDFKVASNREETWEPTLEPVTGVLKLRVRPADAELYIDGKRAGAANRELELVAIPHQLELRKPGYAPYRQTVTPRPGFPQRIDVTLLTEYEAWLASFPEIVESSVGLRLKRVETGRFTMGSPRREQGRQANETERDVELTRLFYIGTEEVTNAAFRQFRAGHSSGIVERKTLDNDNYPVVRVSWEDAVEFCNWLSVRDGLPPAYKGGKLIEPVTTGYRLPTEAEWAWVARFAGGRSLKYPWGAEMPPPPRSGNYADQAAVGLIREHLLEYNDGYAAAAPVGRFTPNVLGVFDLGGNVSEWMNDHFGAITDLSGRAKDPLGTGSGPAHVARGSSWRHGRITELRLSWRDAAVGPRDDLGFRLARYAE